MYKSILLRNRHIRSKLSENLDYFSTKVLRRYSRCLDCEIDSTEHMNIDTLFLGFEILFSYLENEKYKSLMDELFYKAYGKIYKTMKECEDLYTDDFTKNKCLMAWIKIGQNINHVGFELDFSTSEKNKFQFNQEMNEFVQRINADNIILSKFMHKAS